MTTHLIKCLISISFLFALTLVLGCGEASEPQVEEAPPIPSESVTLAFERLTLDSEANGPAFVSVEDLNDDGRLDLIVSRFGQVDMATFTIPNGEVVAYLQGESLMEWTTLEIVTQDDGIIWPNDVTLHDIDDDGDLDALVPGGFLACAFIPGGTPCGSLHWFENTGADFVPHPIVEGGNELFFHLGLFEDIDGDGIRDLLTVGEQRPVPGMGEDQAVVMWFKGNTTADRFELAPRIIGDGLGSAPTLIDLDEDGDLDIASAEFFANMGASFSWFERLAEPSSMSPAGQWKRHVIDDEVGPAIQLSFIPNLVGDGKVIAVGANHTNTAKNPADPWESAVYMYEIPAYPREPWVRTKISDGIVSVPGLPAAPQAAPGIFGHGDADGDGDIDLIVSGDGDPGIYLIEQTAPGMFRTWLFDQGVPQAGGMKISDLNGDGIAEIVATGYENNAVYLYTQADNGPHPIAPVEPMGPELVEGVEEGEVLFHVLYDGEVEGNLLVALFEGNSAAGPPVAIEEVVSATFPADVLLEGLPSGEYVAVITLDAEPLNPMVAGPEDVTATVAVSLPSALGVIEVALGGSPTPEAESPEDSLGDVSVTVNYAGFETGDVILAVFSSLPPTGAPAKYQVIPSVGGFPVTAVMEGVPAGTHQLMAYLDLAPFDPAMGGVEDPIAETSPFVVGTEPVALEVTLVGTSEVVPPPAAEGACTNAADSALISGLGEEGVNDLGWSCGPTCFLAADQNKCYVECYADAGFTDECSVCFGSIGVCTLDNCLEGFSADEVCIEELCQPAFKECAGIDSLP